MSGEWAQLVSAILKTNFSDAMGEHLHVRCYIHQYIYVSVCAMPSMIQSEIREDDAIEVEPVVDRDTAGVPGSPDIALTIFGRSIR